MTEVVDPRDLPADRAAAFLRESLRVFGAVRFRVTGTSMSPAIASGEVVELRAAQAHPPRFGDVVLVDLPEGMRLHRLVFTRSKRQRTKGDGTRVFDRAHPREQTLGTVVGVERPGRGLVPVFSRARALSSLLLGLTFRLDHALRAG
jgi:hypothetical protein